MEKYTFSSCISFRTLHNSPVSSSFLHRVEGNGELFGQKQLSIGGSFNDEIVMLFNYLSDEGIESDLASM